MIENKSPVVFSIVSIDRRGRILMVLKNGNWILPGGKPEYGESELETILRELGEELPGSELKGSLLPGFSCSGITPNSRRPVTVFCYIGDIVTPRPIATSREIEKAKWFSKDEIPWNSCEHLKPLNKKILEKLVCSGHL